MAEKYAVLHTTVPSAAVTTTGQSATIEVGTFSEAIVFLNVTAASGTTPTLDVRLQTSPDNVTWFNEGSTFAQIVAASTPNAMKISNVGRFIRYAWTIAGTTPSFTFSIQTVLKG